MPSDPFHDKPLYPSSSPWGIPDLPYASPESAPQWLVPYRTRIRDGVTTGRSGFCGHPHRIVGRASELHLLTTLEARQLLLNDERT